MSILGKQGLTAVAIPPGQAEMPFSGYFEAARGKHPAIPASGEEGEICRYARRANQQIVVSIEGHRRRTGADRDRIETEHGSLG
jgi:hypothetical protein